MSEFTRSLTLDATRADADTGSVPCTVASEHPVERRGFREILLCTPAAVDLSRSPLPLLVSHDHDRLPVGTVENLRASGGRLRGTAKFGSSPEARQLFRDVLGGTLRSLSVGYQITADRVDRAAGTVTATRWQPHEVSIVSVPADPQSAFFRSHPMSTQTTTDTDHDEPLGTPILDRLSRSEKRRQSAFAREERERVGGIIRMMRHFGLDAPEHLELEREMIDSGVDLEDARLVVRKLAAANMQPVPVEPRIDRGHGSGYETRQVSNPTAVRAFGGDRREQESRAYAAGMWLRSALFGDSRATAWVQSRGMSSTQGGQSLVPEELSAAIISLQHEYGVARRECQVWGMSSDMLSIPVRLSGLQTFWIGEGQAIDESVNPGFTSVNLVARKLATLLRISSELTEDAVVDLASYVSEECARVFAQKEDQCLFLGDGTSTYGGIVGIKARFGSAGSVPAAAGHDLFEEIDAADLTKLVARLPEYARRGAKFYCSAAAADMVFGRLMMAAGGATAAEISSLTPQRFGGYEIVTSDVLPGGTTSLAGQPMIYFGNLRQGVAMGDRKSIGIVHDSSRYLEFDQIAIRATERFDLVAHLGGVDTAVTAGPVVALVGA